MPEVRPVSLAEMPAFEATWEAAWGFTDDDERRQHIVDDVTAESPIAAYSGSVMTGTAMWFAMELTVPGQRQMQMAGVSYVGVHPLHRRRGVLRALMSHQLSGLHDKGIALAGLGASEGAIYGRFGYGPATWDSSWRLPRGAARHLVGGTSAGLELIDAATAHAVFPDVHDRARRLQVGDIRTTPGQWRDLTHDAQRGESHFLLARAPDGSAEGYAVYRLERPDRWSAQGTVIVSRLVAATAPAYRALWAYLADLDLTDSVVASGRPEHEPLRWMLADRRQLEVTGVYDHLWVRLVDLPAALAGRRYAAEGTIVLEVTDPTCPWNAGRWLLECGPSGARCRPAGTAGAVISLDVATLGSLFLGGTSVAHLAAAGLIGGDEASLLRAGQLFGAGVGPWCSTYF